MTNSDFQDKIEVWGENFEIDVSYICYDNEEVLDSQVKIYNNIKNRLEELYEVCKTKIYEYVEQDELKELFPNNTVPKDDILKFIVPKAIIIDRDTNEDYFGFLFYFRYDRENDMCVSFKNYEFFDIGPEYIIL